MSKSKKHGGKIPVIHKPEGINKNELPRVNFTNPRGLSKAEISEAVNKIIDEIYEKYPYEESLAKAKDSGKEETDTVFALLNGDGINGVSVQNLPFEYLSYKRGMYDAYCFLCDVEKLFSELNREFEEITDMVLFGSFERKETDGYERS